MAPPVQGPRPVPPPPPPPPPPERKVVDQAVRAAPLHQGNTEVPPPERYQQHVVEPGENLAEISRRYQTTVPMLQAANPQLQDLNQLEVDQKINVPIGADYGREPTRQVVAPGQTLTDMARQHPGVSAQDIARANRHEIPNAGSVQPGQEVWVPANSPPTPLQTSVQATDRALTGLEQAQSGYDELPADTNRFIRNEMYQGVQTARTNLTTAARTELDERVKATLPAGTQPTEADYTHAAAQLKDRYQADPVAAQRLDTALTGLAQERYRASPAGQADGIVSQARAAGDMPQQMQTLGQRLRDAPPEVRAALLNSTDGQKLLQEAADWAADPLAGGDADKADEKARKEFNGANQRAPGLKAMERLEQVTRELDPSLAAQLTAKAMPTVAKYVADYQGKYGLPFGQEGMANMLKVLDRGANTADGQANLSAMAKLGVYDRDSLRLHVSQGGSPAYAVALTRELGDMGGIMQQVADGMATYRASIGNTAKAYAEEMSELGWLVSSHGGAMTPEQLDKAIADYRQEKGPEWEAKVKGLQDQLASQGQTLLMQMAALEPGADNSAILQGVADDKTAQLAITTALQTNPALTTGPQGEQIVNLLSTPAVQAKLGDQGRKLIGEFATAYAKTTVLDKIGSLDPNNPASVARAKDAVQGLKESRFAKLMGLSSSQMDDVVSALEDTIPKAGESADDIAKRVGDLDKKLNDIKGLDKSTFNGQLMRGVGLGLAGAGFMFSAGKAIDDPSLKNSLKVIVDAAGLGQKGTELLTALGKIDAESAAGKFGSAAAGKFLGVLGAGFDVWNMGESFSKGDIPSGVLYGVGATGGLMAALGGGSLAGPIGIGLVVISVIGLSMWNSTKEANKHEPNNDGGVSLRFLQHAGLSEPAARALVDQSGDGYSVVPLLNRYAELKGLKLDDPAQQRKFVDWINAMSPEQLEALRDNLHRATDKFDGDASRLNPTADDDSFVVPDIANRPWFTRHGSYGPSSVAQLEAQLDVLQIRVLG